MLISIVTLSVITLLFALTDALIIWSDYRSSRRFLKEMEENIKKVYEINDSIKEELNEVSISDKSNSQTSRI